MYFISWNPEAEFLRWMGYQYHLTGGEAFLIPPSVEAWYEADMTIPGRTAG